MLNNSTIIIIGLDIGDKLSYLAVLDQEGTLIEETRLPTPSAELFCAGFLGLLPAA